MKALKITTITPGKRADKTGLRVGDIIVRYNGTPVNGDINAMAALAVEQENNQNIPLEVLTRDGLKTVLVEGGSLSIMVESVDISDGIPASSGSSLTTSFPFISVLMVVYYVLSVILFVTGLVTLFSKEAFLLGGLPLIGLSLAAVTTGELFRLLLTIYRKLK